MSKKLYFLSVAVFLVGALRGDDSRENKQKFVFINKTEKTGAAQFYYDGAENFAQYTGFPIKPHDTSTLKLKEFWWFEKKAFGLLKKKGEPSRGVVEVLMHHAANHLKITIPGVGQRDFVISGEQMAHDSYTIKIFYNAAKKLEISVEKNS